jgi:hypothetical protein
MVGCTFPEEPYGNLDTGRGFLRVYRMPSSYSNESLDTYDRTSHSPIELVERQSMELKAFQIR